MVDYKTGQRNPLVRIAIRVLSQTTSSSQCERNWSTFSLIHTKVRNRLSATRLEKLVYCHYNMRLRLKCIRERQKKSEARLMTFAGSHWEQRFAEREAASPAPIDVDELFDEEHPLNAWVETRQERDVAEFDPRDCSWAEGELDGVEARDPELRVSEDQPLTLGPLFTLPPTLPALRRAPTQKEKSSKGIEPAKKTYTRQKKRKVQQPIRSDDSTQDPNDDDDDDDDGAATGATGAGQGYAGYTGATGVGLSESYVPETEHEGGGGEGQGHGQGGYEGQQHHAAYEWPPWEPNYSEGSTHIPAFQPPILPYSDISSSPYGVQGGWGPWPSQEQEHSEATSTYKPLGIWCPAPSQSGESTSQQFTPRGIQMGMHDLANSLFGYTCEKPKDGDSSMSGSGWKDY